MPNLAAIKELYERRMNLLKKLKTIAIDFEMKADSGKDTTKLTARWDEVKTECSKITDEIIALWQQGENHDRYNQR